MVEMSVLFFVVVLCLLLYLVDVSLYVFCVWYLMFDEFQDQQGWLINVVYGFVCFLFDLFECECLWYIVIVFDEVLDSCFWYCLYVVYKVNCDLVLDVLCCQFVYCKVLCVVFGLVVLVYYEYEVDDLIGSVLYVCCEVGMCGVIVFVDKDLLQLLFEYDEQWDYVCNQCWGMVGVKVCYGVYVYQIVDYLVLCGDVVDNIFGVIGVGVKFVVVLLVYFGSLDMLYECIDEVLFLCLCGVVQMVVCLCEQCEYVLLWWQLIIIVLDVLLDGGFVDFSWVSVDVQMLQGLCDVLWFGLLICCCLFVVVGLFDFFFVVSEIV